MVAKLSGVLLPVGFLAAVGFGLSACGPAAVVGAGAAAGALTVHQMGAEMTEADLEIRRRIQQEWAAVDGVLADRLSATVSEGRVLVTGTVSMPEQRIEAIRTVWDVPGVVEVMNEVEIAEEAGLTQAARDGWIRAQLRSKMTMDSAVRAIDYSVDVVDGVVYLMGSARSEDERDRVVNSARQIPYVARVVDYIRVGSDPVSPA